MSTTAAAPVASTTAAAPDEEPAAAQQAAGDPPTRYAVMQLDITVPIPNVGLVVPLRLGDDRSIAGSWNRFVPSTTGGVGYTEQFPFVYRWGGKIEVGFEKRFEQTQAGFNMPIHLPRISHFNGRQLAGRFLYKTPLDGCEPVESYILETKSDGATVFNGLVYDMDGAGRATGSLGAGPCREGQELAFYWDGKKFEQISDGTLGSYGLRLEGGRIEGVRTLLGDLNDPDTVFRWDLSSGIVTHYLPGDPAAPSFEPDLLPDPATLGELIVEDDPWYGRLNFNTVRDVSAEGCILVDACFTGDCGHFLLIPQS